MTAAPKRDHRDLVIEALSLAEVDPLDAATGWRAVARAAIRMLHDQGVELTRLRVQHHRLVDEYRE